MKKKQDYILDRIKQSKRANAGVVDLLKKNGDYKQAAKISDCSSQVTFVGYVNDPNRISVLTHRCNDPKLCKICGEARKHRLGSKTESKIDATGVHEMYTRHYVLSIDNTDDIETGFNSILQCKAELSKVIRERKSSEFYHVSAYLGSIEMSKSGDQYHPHIHLITFSFAELNDKKLQGDWRRITRRVAVTTGNVETPAIKSMQHMHNITRYMNKQPALSDAELIEYKRVTFNRNLFFTGGFLYGVPLPDNKLNTDNEQKMFSFYEVASDGETCKQITDTSL